MNDKQRAALAALCERYHVPFNEGDYIVGPFDLPPGYVVGWIGDRIYVGCSPDGDISS